MTCLFLEKKSGKTLQIWELFVILQSEIKVFSKNREELWKKGNSRPEVSSLTTMPI